MMKKQDRLRPTGFDRAKPKNRIFHTLVKNHFKRHRSDTGLVEDRTSSVTVVRIIVGLLMIHLVVIGGVLLRGQMVKDGSGLAAPTSISPPPSPLAPSTPAAPAQDVLPQPTVAPAQPRPIVTTTHITQAAQEDDVADEAPEDEPVIISTVPADPARPVFVRPAQPTVPPVVTPIAATPAPAAPAEPIRHKVAPGDTIYRIAGQYNVTEAALRAANPALAQGVLRAGTTLVIPTGGQSSAAQVITAPSPVVATPRPAQAPAPAQPAQRVDRAPAASSYVVSKGDTLSSISRKVGVPMQELMRLNGIKKPNHIRIGQKLRLR